jgi:hypothetical protein
MKFLKVLFCALLVCSANLSAQYQDNLMFGIKAGASRSSISNLPTILVSEHYYVGYQFTEEPVFAPLADLFINYRINESRMAMEGRLGYFQQAASITYSDIEEFTYTCKFQYHYLGLGAGLKTYITKGFNAGVGMRFGFILQPDNLTYASNAHQFNWGTDNQPPSDEETQQELRDVIKAVNSTGVVFHLGYEFPMGLSLDLSYLAGLNDTMETLVNRHNFVDSKNKATAIQLTAGWAISVDKSKKDKRYRR